MREGSQGLNAKPSHTPEYVFLLDRSCFYQQGDCQTSPHTPFQISLIERICLLCTPLELPLKKGFGNNCQLSLQYAQVLERISVLTWMTMWDRSKTRQSCLQTSRFFSKGVRMRFSSSSRLASSRLHFTKAARSWASISSAVMSGLQLGRLGTFNLQHSQSHSYD